MGFEDFIPDQICLKLACYAAPVQNWLKKNINWIIQFLTVSSQSLRIFLRSRTLSFLRLTFFRSICLSYLSSQTCLSFFLSFSQTWKLPKQCWQWMDCKAMYVCTEPIFGTNQTRRYHNPTCINTTNLLDWHSPRQRFGQLSQDSRGRVLGSAEVITEPAWFTSSHKYFHYIF